jgi:hypothetical protein
MHLGFFSAYTRPRSGFGSKALDEGIVKRVAVSKKIFAV